MKVCTKCLEGKPEEEFSGDAQKKDGLASSCRTCMSAFNKARYQKNLEAENARSKAYREANAEKELARSRKYRQENREDMQVKSKAYYQENREACLAMVKDWSVRNRTRLRQQQAKYLRERRANDLNFRLAHSLRTRLRRAMGNLKRHKTLDLTGCTIEELRVHLESLFLPGMSWENYGRTGWHIDHRIPCCNFDMTDDTAVKQCFHFTNLQPLWAMDNFKKGGRFVGRAL